MLKQNLLSGFFWTIGLKILSAVIQIGTLAILSRLLTPVDFGTMGILLMIVGFSKIFSEFGLGAAIVQKTAVDKKDQQAVLFVSLLISGFFTIVFFTLSGFISSYFNNPDINLPLKVISFVFLIDSIVVIQIAIAQKQLKFKFIAIVAFVSYLLGNSVLTIILAYLGFSIWALVFGYMSVSIITFIAYIFRFGFVTPSWRFRNVKDLFWFGSYYTIGRITNYFANNADYFVIGKVLGAQSLGYYTRAYQMMSSPANLLGGTLQKLLFPAFAKIKEQKNNLKEYFLISNFLLAYLSLTVSVIVVYYADIIVNLILGPGWELVIFPLKILSIGLVFKLGYKITTPIMNAVGLVKIRAIVESVYLLLILIFTFIGTKWGINGASIGVLLALIFNFIIANLFCLRFLEISKIEFSKQFIKPVLVSITLLGLLVILNVSFMLATLYLLVSSTAFYYLYKRNIFKKEINILKKVIR